jgi:deazaflavin-dependent oxidoreductase (nitroreductase family)
MSRFYRGAATVAAMDRLEFNRQIIDEFRANAGKVSGPFEGAPMLLLTTTGAKTGRRLTSPLVYSKDGDDIVVIASKAGAPTNPSWFHNLKANPTVTVEVGTEEFEARAEITEGAERQRLFDAQAELMPNFKEYEAATDRVIPVVRLRSNHG